jgi:hypothetical protein
MSKVVGLRAGANAAAPKNSSEQAKLTLAAPPPTLEQARDLADQLASAWSAHLFTDARMDGIAEMLMHFPIEIGKQCADRWNGIAGTKIRDPREDLKAARPRLEPRRFPPSDPEIRDWCEQRVADLWKLSKACEIAERLRQEPQPEDPTPPKTDEDKARVQAAAAEFIERHRPRLHPPPLDPIYLARKRAEKPIDKTPSEEATRAFADLIAAGKLDAKPPPASAWWPLSNPDFVVDTTGRVVPRIARMATVPTEWPPGYEPDRKEAADRAEGAA